MASNNLSAEAIEREIKWRQSAANPRRFLSDWWKIPIIGQGAKPFNMRTFQEKVLDTMAAEPLMIGLKARQIGMTTVAAGYAFWSAFFSENQPWIIVSKNEDGAKKVLKRVLYGYDRLPQWMKDRPGSEVTERSQQILAFSNGSSIEALPAVASTGRGDSVYGAILDEFAFMDYAAEVHAAVEPLVYGKMILISTANGMGNRFHEIWLDSEREDSPWEAMFFPWWEVPSRAEGMYVDEDGNTTSPWHEKKKLEYRGQEWKFYQEYPGTAEEAFAKSGRVAFAANLLSKLRPRPPAFYDWNEDNQTFVSSSRETPFSLRVWEEPVIEYHAEWSDVIVRKPNYVVSVDTAEGNEWGDFTAVTVWNANEPGIVASMRAHFPIENLHNFLWDLGEWYYWALMIPERNNTGMVPLTYLHNMRYPRMYRPKPMARRQAKRSMDFGWTTSVTTKPKMVYDFVAALASDSPPDIPDADFVQEAYTFVSDDKGGFAATEGKHDDFIMAALVGWQGVLEVGRFPIIFNQPDNHPVTFDEFFAQGKPPKAKPGLDAMIIGGRHGQSPPTKTGIMLHPANFRRDERSR